MDDMVAIVAGSENFLSYSVKASGGIQYDSVERTQRARHGAGTRQFDVDHYGAQTSATGPPKPFS